MILVDPRDGPKPNTTSVELRAIISRLGVPCELNRLDSGDAYFEGNGPKGKTGIGVERKTLADMLNCIDDSHYSAGQKVTMRQMYGFSFLILEGVWMPERMHQNGTLWESVKGAWRECRYRSQRVLYSKLFRYMLSVQLTGVIVIPSQDIWHTAYNITEIYHYFQKKWDAHTSMLQTESLSIPDLRVKPPLVRRWAADLTGVGVKHSMEAEKLFKTAVRLANSDESDWMRIDGLGVKRAQQIVREITER